MGFGVGRLTTNHFHWSWGQNWTQEAGAYPAAWQDGWTQNLNARQGPRRLAEG